MLDKKTFRRELFRMWGSIRRDGYEGGKCPLDLFCNSTEGENIYNLFEINEIVEKWSKEHPPKKFKVSRFEYDTLKSCIECLFYGRFFEHELLMKLLKKGYFQGAKNDTYIYEYLNNCEVVEDDG